MGERSSGRATSHHLDVSSPEQVRNVVLVGPNQSGKTSLVEALLLASGAVSRAGSIAERNTVCDYEESERAHERSSSLAVAPLLHAGCKINLLDTPGYADFVGEVRAGLRAADCALFVVAANEPVHENTRQLWRECAAVQMPRAVVVTKLDHARADFDATVRAAREAFGDRVLPVAVPEGDSVSWLLGGSVDDERRAALIEAVIEESEDESLMERYLEGEPIDEELLVRDLEKAVALARLHPVLSVCATDGRGCNEILELCVRGFPAPSAHPAQQAYKPSGAVAGEVTCDPSAPLVAEVVKTSSDQYVGRVSIVRVFSGTLVPDATVHVSGHFSAFFSDGAGREDHDEDERIGALAYPFGQQHVPAARVVAGDIALIGRLSRAETGDTLSSPDQPRVLRPWTMPTALLPVAIEVLSRSDEDKLSPALARLRAEDPSLRIEQNAETGQVVLWVMGEAHADLALERLRGRYGVTVASLEVVVPLRETFTAPAKGHGRHVKQSGGHGQYAICDVEVESLPQGSGFEFVDKVVGGAVPRQFIGSVEKGLRSQMERGVSRGYPVVDIRVTLTDGKAHSVDSSDAAFQSAGALALREAAEAGEMALLEPYDEVAVLVPSAHVGTVMSDLSARRGRLLGTEDADEDRISVKAAVPQIELVRYAIDLRAITHGAGTFTRVFADYELMPQELAGKVDHRGR
ncbi:MAG: translation elongation factor 2 [Marmoricola sp.]|nr:translation elongation factor 2 [Marmoricola sp.]